LGKITYTRGTSMSFGVTYSNDDGSTAVRALFTVKSVQNDSDPTDTTNSIMAPKDITMTNNAGAVWINPSDVAVTVAPGKYYYSVHMIDSNNHDWPVDSGTFTLLADPTNRYPT
jgi:hypothetical protein